MVGIALDREQHSAVEPCSTDDLGIVGAFDITVIPTLPYDLQVAYTISGTAINGTDYTNLSGTVTVPASNSTAQIFIQPKFDPVPDFDELVTLTLVLTNGYLIDSLHPSATMLISECTNAFAIVATNVPFPSGIDYHPPTQKLILGVNLDLGGLPFNFASYGTDHVLTNWSGVSGIGTELKPLIVKATAYGFTNGDILFNTTTNGQIAWLSADGTISNLNWCVLSNQFDVEADPVQGSLWLDQTGIWSNNLLAATGWPVPQAGTRGIWRVPSPANPTQIQRIESFHLEGLLTLSNNADYGPWSGKLLTADEEQHLFFTMDTNGIVTSFDLGIAADKLLIIPTNQDLYCVYYNDSQHDQGMILKVPRALLSRYAGAFLAEQAGEAQPEPFPGPKLFIIEWNPATSRFDTRAISVPDSLAQSGHFEGVTFAPIDITPLTQ
jgi:hypothetical protein